VNPAVLSEELFQNASLCVVGNVNRDVKTAPFAADEALLQDGETPVDAIVETIGGGGAISACAAAALGAHTAFIGKVGADALGDRLEQTLTRQGITCHLARSTGHPTGNSLALNYASGQRHFVSCQPNNASLAFEDLDLRTLPRYRHLLRADVWFSRAMLMGGNARLFRAAREAGLQTSLDLNWDPQWGIASAGTIRERKEAVRSVLPGVDLAHGNVRELCEFAKAPDLETALQRLTHWGVSAVVVHLGAKGAGFYRQGRLIVVPPTQAERQVHSAGTGDVLSVCVALLSDHPDVEAKLRLANTIVAQYMEGRRPLVPSLA